MNRPIGRFVFRGCDEQDGLLLGMAFKGHGIFEPNTVYQLEQNVLDEDMIIMRRIGKSSISECGKNDNYSMFNWAHNIDWILDQSEKAFIIARHEKVI